MTVLAVEHWNWRVSAHARLVSLAGAWVLLFMASAPAGLLVPLAALRAVASPIQLLLNRQLGRSQPLDRRGRLDWFLFAVALMASMGVSIAQQSALDVPTALLLASVLSPLSIIQLRAAARSYRTHKASLARPGKTGPQRGQVTARASFTKVHEPYAEGKGPGGQSRLAAAESAHR